MNILDALKQLRNDIKVWVTNNLNALNTKIDEKTIPIDSELSSTSTNPVQNKAVKKAIDNIPRFSGSYNDLTDAPNITEDDSGNMVIADESGNIIFKADADGIHTTAVTVNDGAVATERYVDEAVANIDIPEVDFTGYATEEYVTTAIDSTKEEISNSIVSESKEWVIVDNDGNIITKVNGDGLETTTVTAQSVVVDGVDIKTNLDYKANIEHVHNQYLESNDISHLAATTYVDEQLAKKADLNHLHEEFLTADDILDKADKSELHTHDNKDELDKIIAGKVEYWDSKSEFSGVYEDLINAPNITEDNSVDLIIADNDGNIVFRSNGEGFETTTLTANTVIANGVDVNIAIDSKADISHSHNDLYYTEQEIDLKLNDAKTYTDAALETAKSYTDTKFSNIPSVDAYTKSEIDAAFDEIDEVIDSKADASHAHSISNVTNLQSSLDAKVPTSRTVNGKALSANISLTASDVGAASSSHNHNDLYYTETEVDTKLASKADKTHNHDADYDAKGSASAVQENLNAVGDTIDAHIDNADIHVTTTNKSNWNTAYTHSQATHARTDATKVADSSTNGNILINGTETNVYTHPNSGVTAGTYKSVTVNAQGHITGGSNPTTLSGYGITDAESKGAANTALASAKEYTDTKVTGLASTTVVDNKVSSHNTSNSAHSDIRDLISGLTTRLNTLANSDDTTLDQMSEVVAYIKNNKSLIDGITTSKVNVSDIANNLTTNATSKVLSAAQGVAIKNLIDELEAAIAGKVDSSVLNNYYTKTQVDNLEFITVDDIDSICGASIQMASLDNEVRF